MLSPTAATSTPRVEVLSRELAVTVTLPKPVTSGLMAKAQFGKEDFRDVAADDVYICPAGQRCRSSSKRQSDGLNLRRYGRAVPDLPLMTAGLKAHTGRSPGGSTRKCWRRCSAASTRTLKPCASAARQSSTRSGPSRPAWVPPTS